MIVPRGTKTAQQQKAPRSAPTPPIDMLMILPVVKREGFALTGALLVTVTVEFAWLGCNAGDAGAGRGACLPLTPAGPGAGCA